MKVYLVDFENVKSKGLTGIDKLEETDNVIIFYSEKSDTISFEMHQKVLTSRAEVEYFKVNVGGKNALDFQLSTLLGYLVGKNSYSHIFVISNDRGFDFLHDFWHGKYVDSPNTIVFRTKTIASAINYASENTSKQFIETLSTNTEPESDTEAENYDLYQDTEITEEMTTEKTNITHSEEFVQTTDCFAEFKNTEDITDSETDSNINTDTDADIFQENNPANLRDILGESCNSDEIETIIEFIVNSDTKVEFHNALAKIFKQNATNIYKLIKPYYGKLKDFYTEKSQSNENTDNNSETCYADSDTGGINAKILELTNNLCTDDELRKIRCCLAESATKRQFYIKMVQALKKDKGCKYYKQIRSEYANLSKMAQEM